MRERKKEGRKERTEKKRKEKRKRKGKEKSSVGLVVWNVNPETES